MQKNIFGEIKTTSISIEAAAKVANVSTATIRNWLKTGYLIASGKGKVTKASLEKFMEEVAGKEKLNARANKLHKNEHDAPNLNNELKGLFENYEGEELSEAYEKSLSESLRNKEGIYYTPVWIIRDMLKNIKLSSEMKFLDPCCGTGNFLIEAIRLGVAPENVYGFDTDPNAIKIAKKRIQKEFGYESENLKVGDFLQEVVVLIKENQRFDCIFTNPPWGKKIPKSLKQNYAEQLGCGNSLDTSALFLAASLSLLKPHGLLGFLMQEAFFNITAFEDIRKKILEKKLLRCVDYEKPFKGLITKAQALILENSNSTLEHKVECKANKQTFERSIGSFLQNPKSILNFWVNDCEAEVIHRLYAMPHITLKGNAKWALGIVTGNNSKYCINKPQHGFVPIFKGSDITKNGLKEPSTFIFNDFSKFQQVAPLEMYHAKEKIIYRFISSDLCFFCDSEQRYILNSANCFIPSPNLGITAEQLTLLLNSQIINWLFKKLFATHKVIRSDLELLPLHVDYFKTYAQFTEKDYLEYLQITKTDGTYRVKKEDYRSFFRTF